MTIAGKVIRIVKKTLQILIGIGATAATVETGVELITPTVEEIIKQVKEIQEQINKIRNETSSTVESMTRAGMPESNIETTIQLNEKVIKKLEAKKKRLINQL